MHLLMFVCPFFLRYCRPNFEMVGIGKRQPDMYSEISMIPFHGNRRSNNMDPK